MTRPTTNPSWRAAALHALPALALILYLLIRWFAVADRYFIFLYYHDMGPGFDTTPFGRETVSRYWMSALVADGAVLIACTVGGWIAGRVRKTFRPPGWWRVWLIGAPVLIVAVPLITMTANDPTLPLWNALQVTVAALAGWALALLVSATAVRQPDALFWLALDAGGLFLLLLALSSGLSNLGRWLANGQTTYVVYLSVAVGLALVWLLIVIGLRAWRRAPAADPLSLLAAAFALTYLVLPITHHVLVALTEGYVYITNSDNLFAATVPIQLLAWALLAGIAFGVARLRARFPASTS